MGNSKGTLMTDITEHTGIKYHWFRSKIVEGVIEIHRIYTDEQKADIFKKCASRADFESKRNLVMGC